MNHIILTQPETSQDAIISAIKERFNQPAFIVYQNLESLLVKASNGEDVAKEPDAFLNDFHGDVCPRTLHAQLITFKVLMKGNDIQCFDDILSAIQSLNVDERQLIDFVVTLCKLIHVNPATSASGERSFSTARRVKTWLRSKMTQARFTELSILKPSGNTHKEKLDKFPWCQLPVRLYPQTKTAREILVSSQIPASNFSSIN